MSKLVFSKITFDVVRAYFPYTDEQKLKSRPGLILTPEHFNSTINQSLIAMITTGAKSTWPFDTAIDHFLECGLSKPCLVRFKLFTLDDILVQKHLGRLSVADQVKVRENFLRLFEDLYAFGPLPSPSIPELHL